MNEVSKLLASMNILFLIILAPFGFMADANGCSDLKPVLKREFQSDVSSGRFPLIRGSVGLLKSGGNHFFFVLDKTNGMYSIYHRASLVDHKNALRTDFRNILNSNFADETDYAGFSRIEGFVIITSAGYRYDIAQEITCQDLQLGNQLAEHLAHKQP